MRNPLTIDGSHGEGGGQVLRSSLTLSALLGQPIRLENIRARRRRPGLAAQHLTAVRAAAAICDATVTGAELGSQRVTFIPQAVKPGEYRFDIGTAGSTSLVFQTLFLPLVLADRSSRVTMIGGTHVSWSPCTHYLQHVFLPLMERMGVRAHIEIERWGWYPKGGGIVHVGIEPRDGLRSPGAIDSPIARSIRGISALSNLPEHIATRQRDAALQVLTDIDAEITVDTVSAPSIGQGTALFLWAELGECRAGFTALGERGKRAEVVGREAAAELLSFLSSGAAVEAHLADQLVLPLALADGASSFTTPEMSTHLSTNLWLVDQFLPGRFQWEQNETVRVQRLP